MTVAICLLLVMAVQLAIRHVHLLLTAVTSYPCASCCSLPFPYASGV